MRSHNERMESKSRLKNIGVLKIWCYKFLKRHLLTFKAGTNVDLKLLDSYFEKYIKSKFKNKKNEF